MLLSLYATLNTCQTHLNRFLYVTLWVWWVQIFIDFHWFISLIDRNRLIISINSIFTAVITPLLTRKVTHWDWLVQHFFCFYRWTWKLTTFEEAFTNNFWCLSRRYYFNHIRSFLVRKELLHSWAVLRSYVTVILAKYLVWRCDWIDLVKSLRSKVFRDCLHLSILYDTSLNCGSLKTFLMVIKWRLELWSTRCIEHVWFLVQTYNMWRHRCRNFCFLFGWN